MKFKITGFEVRLWHKDLLPVLPDEEIVVLWAQVLKISSILEKGEKVKGIYVRRVNEYPANHLFNYGKLVYNEIKERGISGTFGTFKNRFEHFKTTDLQKEKIFQGWHNDRYLRQCYSALEERYDNNEFSDLYWLNLNIHIRQRIAERIKHGN